MTETVHTERHCARAMQAQPSPVPDGDRRRYAIEARDLNVYYGTSGRKDVDLAIRSHKITAIIGPSGCGKSTVLRAFNRMNDLVPGCARRRRGRCSTARTSMRRDVDPVEVRRRIGMVFQKPNPFPKSIYENVAWGARINGYSEAEHGRAGRADRCAARRCGTRSRTSCSRAALALSGGQQQRLCIARAIAVEPEIILMDEPCSALDPIATLKIEELMRELARDYTIVIVTHNMQQAPASRTTPPSS